MTALPDPRIRHRWVLVASTPPSKRIGRFSLIVDKCFNTDGTIHSIHVAYVRDHPYLRDTLATLPHVPRAVRSIFVASVRLGFFFSTEPWRQTKALDAADAAWATYQRNARAQERMAAYDLHNPPPGEQT